MSDKAYKVAGIASGLMKMGQQLSSDLESMLKENSTEAVYSFAAGQYLRLGAAVSAAYCVDECIKKVENAVLPKPMHGLLGAAAFTVGIGALINAYGSHIGLPEGYGVIETTKHLMSAYSDTVKQVMNLDTRTDALKLLLTFGAVKSTARFAYNMLKGIGSYQSKTVESRTGQPATA